MSSSPFHTSLLKDKATPKCEDVMVSRDSVSWTQMAYVYINNQGNIVGADANQRQESILISGLQSCHVLINTLASTHHLRRRFSKNKPEFEMNGHEAPPALFIRSNNNDKLYLELTSQPQFISILSSLLAWQNLRPQGLAKKWFSERKGQDPHQSPSDSHELLVCRFKIYGPIPSKSKSVHLVSGPRAPGYFEELHSPGSSGFSASSLAEGLVPEGWFYTMGVLKSNGMLNFITELDGTLLYSIDINCVFSSEIRQVHHSICHSPNTLFIGHIKELRLNNVVKSTTTITPENTSPSLLLKEGRPVVNNSRILIEFPLHIDLEDWFVGLNYFCRREYIGIYDENSRFLTPCQTRVVDLEGTIDPGNSSESESLPQKSKPKLADFTRDHLQVSKRVTLDIIEANLGNIPINIGSDEKVYAEVLMWGYPWARTSIVNYTQNPFWKEEFSTDLPVLTQILRIVIKQCSGNKGYSHTDRVLGQVYITPDILTQKLRNLSTMMVGTNSGDNISVPCLQSVSSNLAAAAMAAPQNNNIVRLSIYDENNLPVGKLLLTVDLKEYFILPPAEFRNLENMLSNCPMKQLIEFCNNTVSTSEIENVSFILLDIFQSLGIEEEWFKSLIDVELVAVDKITRRNYQQKKTNLAQSTNIFNTLFRGSSIFTKSLEKYNFRVGQEYLEKVFGNFFEKISTENKNCEIDPRYIRLQEKAKRKRKTLDENADFDDSDSESYDSDEEKQEEERIKQIVEENFVNLCAYTKDIWSKIYLTSNDLPSQIRIQLKNFRTKVDLVCDPEDKTTSLNCMSAFVFLRFFCPAILNPKLFYLTKNHQTGQVQRTLTVIAKILLNLANRQQFSPNKEAHLVKMNEFLRNHEHEVLDYFDKVSGRRNDFNEKILDLSHEMKRFDLGLSGNSASNELPTTPYLIDKNLRLTELIHLLQLNGSSSRHLRMALSASLNSFATTINLDMSTRQNSVSARSPLLMIQHERVSSLESGNDIRLNNDRNVYQIGSLEFEKSDFLDLAGDNETEGFIKSLCRSNEEIFSFINSNVTLKDLQVESANLGKKINILAERLQQAEDCSNLKHDDTLWEAFVDDILQRACLNLNKNCIAYYEPVFQGARPPNHKLLVDNALSAVKLKITSELKGNTSDTFPSGAITNMMRRNTKNPFKRWLKKE
ncbi:Rho GTPase activation protein [Metschnikowia bicuspidata var. bicuspidata NRRL YB-4993]|uniref:Rho GTPase activation protein n=1 Tax=Metschnikowia bicuspidata var. bicuspidata NRRL YB-4993 TaxID=869754 RepID=A0A1A0HJA9_9ASCO|nr:Rho GTPase activation protein [Metschnikowia bicuspidata var. bicuspidata NRRL YB-4993]OBA23972.1 Rho GTPase activation protein [Metschnikowia bicuspidata var. bicuspidata NRRL YB-4993]